MLMENIVAAQLMGDQLLVKVIMADNYDCFLHHTLQILQRFSFVFPILSSSILIG